MTFWQIKQEKIELILLFKHSKHLNTIKNSNFYMVPKERTVIGLHEPVIIKGKAKSKQLMARIDTGAKTSSIDRALAKELSLGPIIKHDTVKSASGIKERPFIKARIEIYGRKFNFLFNLADRTKMNYKVLIGQNILRRGFIIDPLLHHKPTKIK
tara:strand:- start:122 stop:586 length:465 start_codon:yes stop_codon:yes gene_type:complete